MVRSQPPVSLQRPLSASEQAEVTALLEMELTDFIRDVVRYLLTPDDSGRQIFRCEALVERTHEAASRIRIDAGQKARTNPDKRAKAAATRMEQLAAAELRTISPLIKAAQMERADGGDRRWAEKRLGEVHFDELRYLMALKARRVSAKDAGRLLEDALAEQDGRVTAGTIARAEQLLGKLLRAQRDFIVTRLGEGASAREILDEVETQLARRFGGPATEK